MTKDPLGERRIGAQRPCALLSRVKACGFYLYWHCGALCGVCGAVFDNVMHGQRRRLSVRWCGPEDCMEVCRGRQRVSCVSDKGLIFGGFVMVQVWDCGLKVEDLCLSIQVYGDNEA